MDTVSRPACRRSSGPWSTRRRSWPARRSGRARPGRSACGQSAASISARIPRLMTTPSPRPRSPWRGVDDPLREFLEEQYEQVASLGRPAPVRGARGAFRARNVRALCEHSCSSRACETAGTRCSGTSRWCFAASGVGSTWVRLVRALLRGTARNGERTVAQRVRAGAEAVRAAPLREAMREGLIRTRRRGFIARHPTSGRSQSGSRAPRGSPASSCGRRYKTRKRRRCARGTSTGVGCRPAWPGCCSLTIAAVRKAHGKAAFAGGMLREGLRSLHRGVEAHPSGGKENAVRRVLKRDRGRCQVRSAARPERIRITCSIGRRGAQTRRRT